MVETKRPQEVGSKSAFIRQHPDLSVEEIISKAKESGIIILPNLVYKVRGRVRAKKNNVGASFRRATISPALEAETPSSASTPPEPLSEDASESEIAFRRLVLELGLQRARALLVDVEHQLEAFVGGR